MEWLVLVGIVVVLALLTIAPVPTATVIGGVLGVLCAVDTGADLGEGVLAVILFAVFGAAFGACLRSWQKNPDNFWNDAVKYLILRNLLKK